MAPSVWSASQSRSCRDGGARCAGQLLDVAIAERNLARVAAEELGSNLRLALHGMEHEVAPAVLSFFDRHLDFAENELKQEREARAGSGAQLVVGRCAGVVCSAVVGKPQTLSLTESISARCVRLQHYET